MQVPKVAVLIQISTSTLLASPHVLTSFVFCLLFFLDNYSLSLFPDYMINTMTKLKLGRKVFISS